jgi:hypothetical protein
MTDEEFDRIQAEDERLGLPVIEQITRAFAGVERGNGVSLHQAKVFAGDDAERALNAYWGQFC